MFWADEIKKYKHDPARRLDLANKHLPLPAAFREAVKALRQMVREERKVGRNVRDHIKRIYELAAVESFGLDYSDVLQQPGYNVMEYASRHGLWELKVAYDELGYEQLRLLTKTDRKWISELWGEPKAHRTLNEIHRREWTRYEMEVKQDQERELREAWKAMEKGT